MQPPNGDARDPDFAAKSTPPWLPGTQTLVDPAPSHIQPGGAPPTKKGRRRRGAIALVLVGVAVLLVSAVALGDWVTRNAEMDAIVDGIEESEAAMITAMAQVTSLVGEWGIETNGSQAQGGTGEAAGQLTDAAEEGLTAVVAAAEQIEAVPVQPWHHDAVAAVEAYLAHNQAWQDYLRSASEDPAAWFVDDPAIESTWEALKPLLIEAVPTPALFNLDSRVERILSDSSVDGGDPSAELSASAR